MRDRCLRLLAVLRSPGEIAEKIFTQRRQDSKKTDAKREIQLSFMVDPGLGAFWHNVPLRSKSLHLQDRLVKR